MKKLIALLTMITCILGLTACGEEQLTAYEQQKLSTAVSVATEQVIPCIDQIVANPLALETLKEYTADEVEYTIGQSFGFQVDGNSFIKALDSFADTYEEIGGTGTITETRAEIDGKKIIVNITIAGPKQPAVAEIILSNDFFFALESAALNKSETMGDLMVKAALNTLLGMGTVFAVLILISLIISALGVIPKLQAKFSAEKKAAPAAGIEGAVAQIAKQEEIVDETDDLELVAVIAAAIAASEGAAGTDGFVVRSVRRRRAF